MRFSGETRTGFKGGPVALLGAWLLVASGAQAALNMGMLGDSLTDEYLPAPNFAHTDLAAYNWVQILSLTRAGQFNFGEYRGADNYWPDRRDAGFEYNFAKAGSSASSAARLRIAKILRMRTSNRFMGSSYVGDQVERMLPHLKSGDIDTVFIGAGSNDFFYQTYNFTISGAFKPRKGDHVTPEFVEDVAGSLLAAVDAIQQAAPDTRILLALIPSGTAGDGGNVETTLAGIEAANALLRQGAAERGIAMMDMFGYAQEADRSVRVGGRLIPVDSAATEIDLVEKGAPCAGACNSADLCAGPSHAERFAAEDGLHPNTIVQGLIANQVLKALNAHFDAGIELLSEDEIIGLTVNQ